MKSHLTVLLACLLVCAAAVRADEGSSQRKPTWSAFPILMYDSDVGFGYGGKAVVKNVVRRNESFDLMLFGSTKGEKRVQFIFSLPDFEIRQGTVYPLAVDVRLDWNALLKSNFFGIGNDSADNAFQFPREMTKFELTLGRGFSPRLVGELWFRYYRYRVHGYDPEWHTINDRTPGAGNTAVSALALRFRYDTRDSFINPSRGLKAELQGETAFRHLGASYDFRKARLELSAYRPFLFKNHVLAFRFWAQHIGGEPPYWEMSWVGDGQTARGYKAERFIDKAMALSSLEYRFRIFGKFGGVLFADAGRVWPDLGAFSLTGWHANWGWGLRYHLRNFVVRFDMGLGPEGTRIFFNFGQVF